MKVKQRQPEKVIQSKTKVINQAPVQKVLQRYKKQTLQMMEPDEDELLQGKLNDPVQRMDLDEEEIPLQGKFETAQREVFEEEDELLQGKIENRVQRVEVPDDEELVQGKFNGTAQLNQNNSSSSGKDKSVNRTGLPDTLKTGIENLSGYTMDDVRVHYNSDKPAQLQALAYTQGTDIHVAPGQEKHLPHEAWYVVQQKQGRVQPTMQLQGVNVNDNEALEKEADRMGGEVCQFVTQDDVEHVISGKMGIRNQINNYGGLCGGWSLTLIKEKNGYEIWEQFERLYDDDNLLENNITKPMINYFKKVMKNQYILDISDYMNYDDEDREGREIDIAILGTALNLVGLNARPIVDLRAARYDLEEYEINDKKKLSDLKEIVLQHGTVLLANNNHFMSIKSLGNSKFYLSETKETGYGKMTWTGVVKCLRKELNNNYYIVNIKYI